MTMDTLISSSQMAVQSAAPASVSLSKKATPEQAIKAGKQFEAMFVSQMLKPMFDTLPTDGWFDGGQGESMFRSMLVDNYAKSMSEHGSGLGLAKAVTQSMLHAQEIQTQAKAQEMHA